MRKRLFNWTLMLAGFCLGFFAIYPALAQWNRGLVYHGVQVINENGIPITDITTVKILSPGTNTTQTVYKDADATLTITQPMTTVSTNTTLSAGKFTWYGTDAFDVLVTSTALGSATYRGLTSSTNNVKLPTYMPQLVGFNTATIDLTNAQIKALQTTAIELVAAPGTGKLIVPKEAVLILDYGTNALTESADNLAIGWDSASLVAAGEAIEATGFIDATADTITNWHLAKDEINAAATVVNKNLCIKNTGDGNYAGNAGADTTLTVTVFYRVIDVGL